LAKCNCPPDNESQREGGRNQKEEGREEKKKDFIVESWVYLEGFSGFKASSPI